MADIYDVAIIGGGPAGLSGALMLGRARRSVLLIDDGHQRNRPVRESHGFLGHDGLSPRELLQEAHSQLKRYATIEIRSGHVEDVSGEIERFTLRLASGDAIIARRIIFATGMYDDLPDIAGLRSVWGSRAFVCPHCDGWEFQDQRMAIIGNTRSALELAQELWDWSHDLVVCVSGKTPAPDALRQWQHVARIAAIESPPKSIRQLGEKVIVECENGEHVECAVIFICAPLKQRSNLPERLDCHMTEDGTIAIDAENRTSVPGCYAAGDCITKHHQIVFAASSAARAAIAINEEFYEADARALVLSAAAQ